MKDSGVEWIGEIPESWEVIKLKYLGDYINGYAFKPSDWSNAGLPIIRIQNLTKETAEINYFNGKIDPKYYVYEGDILISWSATIDIFVWLRGKAVLNQHIFKVNVNEKKVKKDYFFYALKIALYEMSNDKHGSAMQHVTKNIFDNYKIPFPSIEIQEAIAKRLDEELYVINSIISETQQSIDELKKYKQALITEAVTKGLDKNVEMKDSGIDWMGSIPSQWRIAKMNSLFRIVKNIANDQNPRVLSVTQSGLKIKDITVNVGQMAADYSKYQSVHKGQFVMNHMDLLTGWIDLSNFTGVTSPDYRVFETKNNDVVFPSFFLYIFQICYTNKIFYGLGQGVSNVGRWRLQTDKFVNFYLPVPSYAEQVKIVEYLKQRIAIINKIIEQKAQLLNHLNIYKQSLIYEYVTGKKEA
ncbi:TPA: hypothetical protein IXZ60_002691 [Enterococcus faecium]|nr:restriction endonuclease subunit S [Enterococcus faecium]NTR86913.1 restriction endonuclease subunit S [Enterococcus faecium]HAQ5484774.1 hypothetical protein [Enterococcus faecium]